MHEVVESAAAAVAAEVAAAAEAVEAVGEDIAVAFDACFASWPGATSLRLAVPCVVGVGEESCSEIAVVGGVADVEVDDDD